MIRQPLGVLLGLMLGVVGVGLCVADGEVDPLQTPASEPRTPLPADPPREFRVMRPVALPEAVDLLQELRGEDLALAARRQLAERYREAGYLAAAAFFRQTAELAEGGRVERLAVRSPIAWAADAALRDDEVAQRIASLLHQDEQLGAGADRAIEMAERYLEDEAEGPAQEVVVLWAEAVLWKVAWQPEAVSDEALEAAIRLYLTALGEKVTRPPSMATATGGYGHLAGLFEVLGDRLSALAATRLALLHASEAGGEDEVLVPNAYLEILCERSATLGRELGLSAGDAACRSRSTDPR